MALGDSAAVPLPACRHMKGDIEREEGFTYVGLPVNEGCGI